LDDDVVVIDVVIEDAVDDVGTFAVEVGLGLGGVVNLVVALLSTLNVEVECGTNVRNCAVTGIGSDV
jgi:hypothetical protein